MIERKSARGTASYERSLALLFLDKVGLRGIGAGFILMVGRGWLAVQPVVMRVRVYAR